jgi:hypothetical protein
MDVKRVPERSKYAQGKEESNQKEISSLKVARSNSVDKNRHRLTEELSWQPGETIGSISFPKITRNEEVDFLEAVGRFCKQDIMVLARVLEPKSINGIGMTLPDLRKETGIDTNQLNHMLIDMGKWGYVKAIGKQRSRLYYLTKYGQILHRAVNVAMDTIECATSDSTI